VILDFIADTKQLKHYASLQKKHGSDTPCQLQFSVLAMYTCIRCVHHGISQGDMLKFL
jgi:hypothetical protein